MWDKNPRFGRDVHAEPPWKWGNKQEKSAILKKNLENGWLFRHITNIEYACYQWTSSLCARLLAFSTSDSSQLFERKNSRQNPLEKLHLSVSKSRLTPEIILGALRAEPRRARDRTGANLTNAVGSFALAGTAPRPMADKTLNSHSRARCAWFQE